MYLNLEENFDNNFVKKQTECLKNNCDCVEGSCSHLNPVGEYKIFCSNDLRKMLRKIDVNSKISPLVKNGNARIETKYLCEKIVEILSIDEVNTNKSIDETNSIDEIIFFSEFEAIFITFKIKL